MLKAGMTFRNKKFQCFLFLILFVCFCALPVQAGDVLPAGLPGYQTGLIGKYANGKNSFQIMEEGGVLKILTGEKIYPLKKLNGSLYLGTGVPGADPGEQRILFTRNKLMSATMAEVGKIRYQRVLFGGEGGKQFRIRLNKPIEELRVSALRAKPPVQNGNFDKPDLIEVNRVIPSAKLDIRYATDNNFMGACFYDSPRAFLQKPVVEALARAEKKLSSHGYGILIYDAYRPWYVTKMFWDATPDNLKDFVANPATGSRHNRGTAVDLSLYDLKTGKPVEMTSGFDEFSERACPDYRGGTSRQRYLRDLLRKTMESEGFTVFKAEWWHFDYKDWQKYPIMNVTFDKIK